MTTIDSIEAKRTNNAVSENITQDPKKLCNRIVSDDFSSILKLWFNPRDNNRVNIKLSGIFNNIRFETELKVMKCLNR